jgi:hypothetical protein
MVPMQYIQFFMDNWKFNLINCDIFIKTNENFFQ